MTGLFGQTPCEPRCPDCDSSRFARRITVEEIEAVDRFVKYRYDGNTYLEGEAGRSLEVIELRVLTYRCLDCGFDIDEEDLVKTVSDTSRPRVKPAAGS